MDILGVFALIAVLVGGVQTAILTSPDDHSMTGQARTPTTEVRTQPTEPSQAVEPLNG
ncbi:hypothetical protein [Thermochromatium tepidum]|jgi:hypothetical protein|uniref:Uncharacterized protein n=1 Tax=Thermochromatium tepidum ATCC 43061 TaxID=316276 RepID=A0A6I6E708_THETI|nr:hypothetical protein [Thermochromatium tepidum]QGU32298.1 hypothetical protein E6P07_04405 [Thermochromatium tepidum ATCC 43061]